MLELEEKKHHLRNFSIICAIGLIILTIYILYCCAPLDEITDYQVHVETQNDGSMDITYRYEWKVLNDTREAPLHGYGLGFPTPAARSLHSGEPLTMYPAPTNPPSPNRC